jgi:hypothetical protein
VITDKDCDELAFIAKHMDVWSAIGHLPRLRPLRTPKSIAKAIREHLKGPSIAVKTERTEIDVAQAELVEAMKRFRQAGGTPARLIVATQAAVGADVGFMHAFAVRLVEEVRLQVNELIRNQKPWGELGGAFLKPMKTWKLLKQPAPVGA